MRSGGRPFGTTTGGREARAATPVRTWIVDTGPLVSYLDASDPAHGEVSACWDSFGGRLVTTSAVVTEAMHFVGDARGARYLAELVGASGMTAYDLSGAFELLEAATLMEKYGGTPMDFADATLLLLAEALDAYEILTLDRRGFATYRTRQGRSLRMVLYVA